MTDISKCSGENCPMKESCYRFTAEAGQMQSYFIEPPIKDGKCEYYWEYETKSPNSRSSSR